MEVSTIGRKPQIVFPQKLTKTFGFGIKGCAWWSPTCAFGSCLTRALAFVSCHAKRWMPASSNCCRSTSCRAGPECSTKINVGSVACQVVSTTEHCKLRHEYPVHIQPLASSSGKTSKLGIVQGLDGKRAFWSRHVTSVRNKYQSHTVASTKSDFNTCSSQLWAGARAYPWQLGTLGSQRVHCQVHPNVPSHVNAEHWLGISTWPTDADSGEAGRLVASTKFARYHQLGSQQLSRSHNKSRWQVGKPGRLGDRNQFEKVV